MPKARINPEDRHRVILRDMYVSYDAAIEMTGLKPLHTRRDEQCLGYDLKAVKHPLYRTKISQKAGWKLEQNKRKRTIPWELCLH